jgi:hypothetical protein
MYPATAWPRAAGLPPPQPARPRPRDPGPGTVARRPAWALAPRGGSPRGERGSFFSF